MGEIDQSRYWIDDFTEDLLEEFLDESQVIYFQFQNKDYLIERYTDGFLIADPIPYYKNGGYPRQPQYQYPESFKAKTVDELLALPFLDGKTIYEQWKDIKFWNY
ncbi:MAG: hypothetical protein Q4A67_03570 [Aerococcus sp.]|nr:hypothetical protein [Aerococcus sp.]